MQQPLPRVRPLPSPGLDQRIDRDMPDIGLSRRGWYDRVHLARIRPWLVRGIRLRFRSS